MTHQHPHADFRPHDPSRSSHRRSADRVLDQARSGLETSSGDVGPHVRLPFSGGSVAAFRSGSRVRFEVIAPGGRFEDYHSGGASRAIASLIADSFT